MQPAVYKIGLIVDAVIIDISRSSPNIEWELKYLEYNKPGKYLVIRNRHVANTVTSPDIESEVVMYSEPSDLQKRVRNALEKLTS